MKAHLYLSVTVLLGLFSSCSPSSNSGDRLPAERNSVDQCIPESSLMGSNGIVGGKDVSAYENDSKKVVLIVSNGMACTASVIAPKVLLTAAHCIIGSGDKIEVVFHNSISCESGYEASQHRTISAAAVKHQQYKEISDESYSYNDVALVFLKENVPYGYKIHKIAEPSQVDKSSGIKFLGYGRIESEKPNGAGKKGTGILRKTQIPTGNFKVYESDNKVLVYQNNGTGICQGDSGGPGFVTVDGEEQILGINSFVSGPTDDICSDKSVLELAHPYKTWIKSEMAVRGLTLAE